MKKRTNNLAKVAALGTLCAFGGLTANAFGVDVDVHANTDQGIGASVDADLLLARANVGTNVGLTGVDATVGADVLGVGANTGAHVGFDGVAANADVYAWDLANVGANAGATWKDGVYVGGTARFLEPANTACVATQNGQKIYVPAQPAPKGCEWVYGNNGRIVGYKPLSIEKRVQYTTPVSVTFSTEERPVRVVRRIVRTVPAPATQVAYSQERTEEMPNVSVYQRKDFYQYEDPANGYRLTDKRQITRRVVRRTVITR